jgi:hypothetical protein
MKLTKLKKLAAVSAVALTMALTTGNANAQVENMTATLTTSSAITTAFVTGIDFGEYFINFAAATTPILRASAALGGPATTTQVGVLGASQVVQITAPATQGEITVQTPAPSVLQMVMSNFTDIPDAGLSLTSIRYDTATEPVTAVPTGVMPTPAQTVTVLAGATDEIVQFGGDIAVTATPADAAHVADFDVTFSY